MGKFGHRPASALVPTGGLPYDSPVYNEDLAPTTQDARTWTVWNIAALWIGMAVCIPTYMLASSMIANGMNWWQAVVTILLGNLIVLVPMMLNAHAGTKYGIPFPVLLRASFGVRGSNVPALLRAGVACGWFGIQTWIGGSALYQLGLVFVPEWQQAADLPILGINLWELVCFFAFWSLNIAIIIEGIDTIKHVESFSAWFLLATGVALLVWGIRAAGGFGRILSESERLGSPSVVVNEGKKEAGDRLKLKFSPLSFEEGKTRAGHVRYSAVKGDLALSGSEIEKRLSDLPWNEIRPQQEIFAPLGLLPGDPFTVYVQFKDQTSLEDLRKLEADEKADKNELRKRYSSIQSSTLNYKGADPAEEKPKEEPVAPSPFRNLFIPQLTAMVCFWATLALNIPDFTRFARSQKDQLLGQFLGLPPTMALYSFIGVAVTMAAVLAFQDVLIVEDAPWDPVRLLGRFRSPLVVIVSMVGLAVATLSTNIAANVVSPANDFSNVWPARISFKAGGVITGIIGILMMPWKLMETHERYIYTWLQGYGLLLGPIAGIMISDYCIVRNRRLTVEDLYKTDGRYRYTAGFSLIAIAVLGISMLPNIPGFLVASGWASAASVPQVFQDIYQYSWFLGFLLGFLLYSFLGLLVRAPEPQETPQAPMFAER